MQTTRIHRSDITRIRPLSAATRGDHGLLSGELERRLGPEAAALLSEPVIAADGATIDWHVPGRVTGVPLARLAEPRRAAMLAELDRIASGVLALADRLERKGSATERDLARALREAMTVPDPSEDHVYEVAGHPVLAAWGHVGERGQGFRPGLSVAAPISPAGDETLPPRFRGTAPPPAETDAGTTLSPAADVATAATMPAAIVRAPFPWLLLLLWLLLAAIVAAILALLLRACAIAPLLGLFGIAGACPGGGAALAAVAGLRAEMIRLEDALADRVADCPPFAATLAPVEPLDHVDPLPIPAEDRTDVAPSDIDERIADLSRGDLEITLAWNGVADLDLGVTFDCPGSGPVRIEYSKVRQLVCGGELDTDANGRQTLTQTPVEHVVFADAAAIPPGPITVHVTYFKPNTDPADTVPYTVEIRRGDERETFTGVARRDEAEKPRPVTTFTERAPQ